MSESARMWMEISFNVLYLVAIWWLVYAMNRRLPNVLPENRAIARLFLWAFALLAVGDTGHVGFRVVAYAQGGLDATAFGGLGLVGLGAFSTAITVTFFYALVAVIWQKRTGKPYGWFGMLLFAAAAIRLVVMAFPQNNWNSVVPPQPWSLYRNAPLVVQGLGAAYLILRDAIAARDSLFKWVGVMILVSYAFYTPVILFVQTMPLIGMLMIPKTLAYVAIAVLAYRHLFPAGASTAHQPGLGHA